jgi:23S rRNA (cytosine1962-C5)-methyltransferase
VVQEGGLRFELNLHGHHDSGLFLDHRKTRAMVRQRAVRKRVLNLFCYTGSFSVYAAAGGAASVTSLDLSRTYLDWTERNFALNELSSELHRVVQGDILQWLPAARELDQEYDLIVCDPPTFSNSKRMLEPLDTVRNHAPLLDMCLAVLAPGGELFFSTNASRFRMGARPDFAEITEITRSEDYRRGGGHRCWHHQDPRIKDS